MDNTTLYIAVADKVIASDLLYYISNKIHSTPVKDVVATCLKFYTDNEFVFGEKKKLCDATNEPCPGRRNENKRQNNLEDICSILTRRDSQGLFIPKFASLNLSNVPTCASGNPTIGQLMAAITDIKKSMVTTEMLESSINNLRMERVSVSASSSSDRPPPPSFAPHAPTPENPSTLNIPSVSLAPISPSAPFSIKLLLPRMTR